MWQMKQMILVEDTTYYSPKRMASGLFETGVFHGCTDSPAAADGKVYIGSAPTIVPGNLAFLPSLLQPNIMVTILILQGDYLEDSGLSYPSLLWCTILLSLLPSLYGAQ